MNIVMPGMEFADHCRDFRLVHAVAHANAQTLRIGAYPFRGHGCTVGMREDVFGFMQKAPARAGLRVVHNPVMT